MSQPDVWIGDVLMPLPAKGEPPLLATFEVLDEPGLVITYQRCWCGDIRMYTGSSPKWLAATVLPAAEHHWRSHLSKRELRRAAGRRLRLPSRQRAWLSRSRGWHPADAVL